MGNLAVKIVRYLNEHKIAFFSFLLVWLCFAFAGIRKLNITEDIFAALPKGKAFQQFSSIIETKNIANQCVFSINVSNTDVDINTELVTSFADTLRNVTGSLLTDISPTRPDVEMEVYGYFYHNFPVFIDSSYYKKINAKLQPDSIQQSIVNVHNQLLSPSGSFVKDFVMNDPLFISSDFFKELNSKNNPQGIVVEDGIVYTKNKKQILITTRTSFDTHNTEDNISLSNKLKAFKTAWNNAHPENRFDYFGTFEIASENAVQVKKDSFLTLMISLVLILLILIVYYRKVLIPIYFVLPAVFGGLFAMGMMGFVRPEISAISLATSAILLGIILDYSFHFFTHLRHTGSLSETVHEITVPLLTGSITTVLALGALYFTDSVVLQDFGLFASIALAGSALFTIIGLPVILKFFKFSYRDIPDNVFRIKLPLIPDKVKKTAMVLVTILTFVFLYFSTGVQFDSELENLSFHPDNLKNKEKELAGINPASEKKIYLFASDEDYNKACSANYLLFEKISALKNQGKIKSMLSAGQFVVPDSIKEQRRSTWRKFWEGKKESTFNKIDHTADSVGFNKDAFSNFRKWIELDSVSIPSEDSLIKKIGIDNLVEKDDDKSTFITTIVVSNENIAYVKSQLQNIYGIEIFDRSETAGLLLQSVRNDFNYILLVSAAIVFFTLLIIFGRIELTLLAFFPMIVSWIWILGISSLLDIKFNFVNVVIATFIFGLGDDFSIFVTDGLLNKYKYRKNVLHSYQSAILLSALTVVIGTGALFFAKHPAIHSVSGISVLGIGVILLISFLFQPFLFGIFVQNRIEKKRTPIPFFQFLLSTNCFAYFVMGCTIFHPAMIVSYFLPFPKKLKRRFVNIYISYFAKSVIYSGFHVRKRIYNKENLSLDKPAIIIANHSSFLDILLMLMLNPRIIIMVKDWVYKSALFGFAVRYAGYIYSDSGNEENLEKIKQRIADGYSIMIFPEGSRSDDGSIQRFHKGAFYLSERLNLDIIPILIHGANEVSPKQEMLVKKGEMNLKILPRIESSDTSWGTNYSERTKSILKHFRQEHAAFKNEREDARYLFTRIFYNYIFKGPIMEWYIRIKYRLEQKNYDFYNELIGQRTRILDVGCGYGYMSFFLHYKNPDRKIVAADYDEEKINIAANAYDKTQNLEFIHADASELAIDKQDVIFLNDILHYLPELKQSTLLQKCSDALNNNGILFIRDGITDLKDRHGLTKTTEFLSTRLFSFNKKENDLHFFSSAFIRQFAQQNNLTVEMQEHSGKTSNVLFILRKGNEN